MQETPTKVIADPSARVTGPQQAPVASPASPLRKDVMAALTEVVHQRYPDVEVAACMSAYGTDSRHFRALGVPSYGVADFLTKPDDTLAHGRNERLPVSEMAASLDFWHALLMRLAS